MADCLAMGANRTNPGARYAGLGEQVQCRLGKMLAEAAVELAEALNFIFAAMAESTYLLSECRGNGVFEAANEFYAAGPDFYQGSINSVHAGA